MNAEQKELFRKAILRILDANRTRFGLGVVNISFRLDAFNFTSRDFGGEAAQLREAITDEIDYLVGKGLVAETKKEISAENRAWRITEKGIALVDSGV